MTPSITILSILSGNITARVDPNTVPYDNPRKYNSINLIHIKESERTYPKTLTTHHPLPHQQSA